MIWESKPWKDELLANGRRLRKYANSKRRSAKRSFEIERSIFLSAYIMRKLWESRKLSSSWGQREIRCVVHQPKDGFPDLLNWHRLDRHYRIEKSSTVALPAIELCNRLVHSFVFVEAEEDDKTLGGFYFASDRTKRRGLWFIQIADLIDLIDETGSDYPSTTAMVRDPKTGEWITWAGHGRPPPDYLK